MGALVCHSQSTVVSFYSHMTLMTRVTPLFDVIRRRLLEQLVVSFTILVSSQVEHFFLVFLAKSIRSFRFVHYSKCMH